MALIMIFYSRQKRVGIISEKVFLRTLIITTVSIVFDIISMLAIEYRSKIPDILCNAINKCYIVSLLWVSYQSLSYVLLDYYESVNYKTRIKTVTIISIIESIVLFLLPVKYNTNSVYYAYGPCVVGIYIFAFANIVATFVCTYILKRKISSQRRFGIRAWMSIWIVASILQIIDGTISLLGFSCALGMLTLFSSLENPEANIDRHFDCFNAHVLMTYLRQAFIRKERFSTLLISMTSHQKQSLTTEEINECLSQIVEFLNEYRHIKVFKTIDQELVVLFPDNHTMNMIFNKLQFKFYSDQFYLNESVKTSNFAFPKTLFVLFPIELEMSSYNEIWIISDHIKNENRNINISKEFRIDENLIYHIRAQETCKESILLALEDDRVEVFLQPIYSTKKQRIVSAEALCRIRNTDGSYMYPSDFIPAAEESGIIVQLGERVFEKTCSFLQHSKATKLGIKYVEVNLSVVQCDQSRLAEQYEQIMKKYSVNPQLINLEITETGSVQTKDTLLKNMQKLIGYGVNFSLDDFGKGQSNLDYIIDMPVSIMKLDMSMTQAYFESDKARYVVQAAIRLAHDMDMQIVAEGIETKEQLDEMTAQGIDYIQGYYFSKPLPMSDFIKYIEKEAV